MRPLSLRGLRQWSRTSLTFRDADSTPAANPGNAASSKMSFWEQSPIDFGIAAIAKALASFEQLAAARALHPSRAHVFQQRSASKTVQASGLRPNPTAQKKIRVFAGLIKAGCAP